MEYINKSTVIRRKKIINKIISNKDKLIETIDKEFNKFQFETDEFFIRFKKILGIPNYFIYIVDLKSKIENLEINVNDFKIKQAISLFEKVNLKELKDNKINLLQNTILNENEELKCYIVFVRKLEVGCLNPEIIFKNYKFKLKGGENNSNIKS